VPWVGSESGRGSGQLSTRRQRRLQAKRAAGCRPSRDIITVPVSMPVRRALGRLGRWDADEECIEASGTCAADGVARSNAVSPVTSLYISILVPSRPVPSSQAPSDAPRWAGRSSGRIPWLSHSAEGPSAFVLLGRLPRAYPCSSRPRDKLSVSGGHQKLGPSLVRPVYSIGSLSSK
jgi:hypothetical protein